MVPANRKTRRVAASQARKNGTSENGTSVPELSAQQKDMISKINAEAIAVERRIAQLDMEKEAMRSLLRSKRSELQSLCENALRGHGVDLDSPQAGQWRVNVETMEVEHIKPVAPLVSV